MFANSYPYQKERNRCFIKCPYEKERKKETGVCKVVQECPYPYQKETGVL